MYFAVKYIRFPLGQFSISVHRNMPLSISQMRRGFIFKTGFLYTSENFVETFIGFVWYVPFFLMKCYFNHKYHVSKKTTKYKRSALWGKWVVLQIDTLSLSSTVKTNINKRIFVAKNLRFFFMKSFLLPSVQTQQVKIR